MWGGSRADCLFTVEGRPATSIPPYVLHPICRRSLPSDRVTGHGRGGIWVLDPMDAPNGQRQTWAVDVRLKRAYEAPSTADGYRVLVDRLWPRGVRKETARLDAWEKELAPSPALREWFAHDPARFAEFRRRYIDELRSQRTRLTALRRRAREGTLTLVYSARDEEHNDAVVLAEILRRGLPARPGPAEQH
jgi:uncharacterized protein YeaO (DUF488 family)